MSAREATVLIAPGLRDHVPQHRQTLLASRLKHRLSEPTAMPVSRGVFA